MFMQKGHDSGGAEPIEVRKRSLSTGKKRLLMGCGVLGLVVLLTPLIFFFRPTTRSYAQTIGQRPTVGINLFAPDQDMFTDAMKTSGGWQNNGASVPQDENGWPLSDANTLVWAARNSTEGTYHLIFKGQATLTHPGTNVTISDQQYDAATNTTTANIVIPPNDAYNFDLVFSDTKRTASSPTNTGVSEVQLFKPVTPGSTTTFDPGTIFTPYVAQAVAPYSYIRIMFGTNWNKSVNWSDRTTVSYTTQHKVLAGESGYEGNQIAFEYMIKIANDNNKDLYVLVPDRVNNDYITKMAQVFRYGSDGVNPYTSPQANPVWAPLKSNLKLYVEYTNEAWNFSFDQAHDLYDGPIGAQQEIANNPNSPLIYDGNRDGGAAWLRNYANRAVNVSKIFRSVFGDSEMGTRIRPLLYWQYNNLNNSAETELLFVNNYYNNADGVQHVSDPHPVSYYFWGGGGAVYFNSNNDGAASVDELFASGIPQSGYQNILNNEALWARLYGLHFMAYEGSWGIEGKVGDQGRVDPRAKQALLDSFDAFVRAGGENYTAGTFGQWDDLKTASSYPLVQAAAIINGSGYTVPAISQGIPISTSVPTIIPGAHYSMTRPGQSGASTNLGNETGYLLNVIGAGNYQVAVNVGNGAAGGKIGVYVDSELLSTITVPNTGSNTSYQSVVAGSTALDTGLHSIILRAQAQPNGGKAGTVNAVIVQPGDGTPPTVPDPGNPPSGWQSADVGVVGQAGSTSYTNSTFSITGSGFDISGTNDAFRYVYTQVNGDATIVARVTWLGDSNPYAKAGVMIRDSLNADAANALEYYSPSGDTTFEKRTTNGSDTSHPQPLQRALPAWVKLVRTGNTVTGYYSPDGSTWTQTGSDTFSFGNTVYIGLVVCAHENSTLLTGDLDNVSINGNTTTPTPQPTSQPTTQPTSQPTTQPTAQPTPPPTGNTLFSTGFEGGQPQPNWIDSVDSGGYSGGTQNVGGVCCGVPGPEAGTRTETAHDGSAALMYAGADNSSSTSYAYLKVLDVSGQNVTVGANTKLDYWIYPQGTFLTSGNNSTCVALDLIFNDGSNLRDSGATDQNGHRAHPEYQCNNLTLNTWNHVVVNLGSVANGKSVVRINVGYDQPGNTGGYRGYIDDISLHN